MTLSMKNHSEDDVQIDTIALGKILKRSPIKENIRFYFVRGKRNGYFKVFVRIHASTIANRYTNEKKKKKNTLSANFHMKFER